MTNSYQFSERSGDLTSSLGVAADWMDALHGNSELQDVLHSIVRLVKADRALLLRSSTVTDRNRIIEQSDVEAGKLLPAPCASYLNTVLGDKRFTARPGSVWSLSDARKTSDMAGIPDMSRGAADALVKESVLITLAAEASQSDFLEIQFRSQPLRHNLDLLVILAGTLVTCWKRRSPGLVAKKLVQTRMRSVSSSSQQETVPLLDVTNPFSLSRSEFRVCAMLQNGMTVKVIAVSLSLSEATIRCHLSSIFSKTGSTCQVELLGLLNSEAPSSMRVS